MEKEQYTSEKFEQSAPEGRLSDIKKTLRSTRAKVMATVLAGTLVHGIAWHGKNHPFTNARAEADTGKNTADIMKEALIRDVHKSTMPLSDDPALYEDLPDVTEDEVIAVFEAEWNTHVANPSAVSVRKQGDTEFILKSLNGEWYALERTGGMTFVNKVLDKKTIAMRFVGRAPTEETEVASR